MQDTTKESKSERLKKIGHRISKMRRERGMNNAQLANKLGISYGTLTDYICGRTDIPASRIDDLCKVLQCDANYLINGNDDIIRITGLTEEACRKFTDTDIEEWGIYPRYVYPNYKVESPDEYRERLKSIHEECGITLSWFIEHGLLPLIAILRGVQCDWENGEDNIKDMTFDEVAANAHLFDTGAEYNGDARLRNMPTQSRLYTETIRAEKALERLVEKYVSKSADNTEGK
ncbi:MAG: helix-turn-helix transcriptional regulator [Eubacterium sp.]|nr:helix-turn-helix transcriptional regulator [Eubacterium sp.]